MPFARVSMTVTMHIITSSPGGVASEVLRRSCPWTVQARLHFEREQRVCWRESCRCIDARGTLCHLFKLNVWICFIGLVGAS